MTASQDSASPRIGSIRLIAGGDVMLGRQMPGWIALHGAGWPFAGIADRLKSADLALVNLETCVSTEGDFLDKGGRQPYYYHNRPEMLDVLSEAGIKCVTTANNHAMDYGPEALAQQVAILDASGFVHFGSGRTAAAAAQPGYVAVNGLTLAFIGVETETACMAATDTSPGIFYTATAEVLQRIAPVIALARERADIVIVTPHWGPNWQEAPSPAIRSVAKGLIDLGADAVLGHSAHILQGVELHAGRPIVYDMGTLLFDRVAQSNMRDSALFELEINAQGVQQLTIAPVKLTSGQAHLATGEDAVRICDLLRRLSRELDATTCFEVKQDSLRLRCASTRSAGVSPASYPAGGTPALPKKTPKLPPYLRHLRSNLVYDDLPADCQWPTPVTVNTDLEILGARFASPVRPGRSFVCEVYFRASAPPMPSRIEARLSAETATGERAFSYTHPVAEGIHPPTRWSKNEIICDRVVVRPGTTLADGSYTLYWQLKDLEEKLALRVDGSHERLVGDKVLLGTLNVSAEAANGVAGLATVPRLARSPTALPYVAWQDNPLRFWNTLARPWVVRALAQLGISLQTGTITVVRNNPWGLVLSALTNRGRIFFKAQGHSNRFEPALLEALSKIWPDHVPRPLAINDARAWMITPNYGPTLRDSQGDKVERKVWQDLLQRLAEIQIESCRDVSRWLNLGVPDRRLEKLPAQLAALLDDDRTLPLNERHGLTQAEREQARALLPYFEECCLSLAGHAWSAGLDQGDWHLGNVIARPSGAILLDWDASVSHPFCTLLLPYHDRGLQDEDALARFSWFGDAYLQVWCKTSGLSIDQLKPTLHRALWVAHVLRAFNWSHISSLPVTKTSVGNPKGLVAKWIRRWIQRKPLLTTSPLTEAVLVQPGPSPQPPRLATADNPLFLDKESITRLTGGTWHGPAMDTPISGMSFNRKYLAEGSQGNLYFSTNAHVLNASFTERNVVGSQKALKTGAVAIVVPNTAEGVPKDMPVLRVKHVVDALEVLGRHVRDQLYTGKRVIVTGTEGKTGFKCTLYHVLAPQIPTHAVLNSSNLDHSIYASLASIRRHDKISIIEAAGTYPGRCMTRSHIVKPHLFVITEVGNEHIENHGSQQALIESKAEICLGVVDGGFGILNADSRNYAATRQAVLARRRLPLLLFGSGPECNGRLLERHFDNNSWQVSADIEGQRLNYRLPLIAEHAPLASVSVLLAAYYLGADLARAAEELASFIPYESQGVLRRTKVPGGEVLLYDNSTRASVLSYQSYLLTAKNLNPPHPNGRKIAMIGQMIFLGDEASTEHARLAEWIDAAEFDCLVFVGKHMEATYAKLKHPSCVVKRFPAYDRRSSGKKELQELIDTLMDLIRPGDLVFVKGEVDEVGTYLRDLEIK